MAESQTSNTASAPQAAATSAPASPPSISVQAATPEKPPVTQEKQVLHVNEKQAPAKPAPITTQPGAQAGMDPHNYNNLPRGEDGMREWSHGLTDCCGDSCSECCFANCCPGMEYANIKSRVRALDETGKPHPTGGENFNGDCFNYCFGGLAFQYIQRQELRRRYKIKGSDGNDVMISWCCRPCDLVQQSREVKLEENAISVAAVDSHRRQSVSIPQPPMA